MILNKNKNTLFWLLYLPKFTSLHLDDSDLKYIEFLKAEKNLDYEAVQKNLEKINFW